MVLMLGPVAALDGQSLPTDEAVENRLRRDMGGDVLIKQTPNFTVAVEAQSSILDEFTARLEHTYHGVRRFAELLDLPIIEPEHKLEICFFDSEESYLEHMARRGFRGEGTYGVYMESSNRSFFYNVENDRALREMQRNIAASQESIDRLLHSIEEIRGGGTPVRLELGDGTRQTMTRAEARERVAEARDSLERLRTRRERYIDHINRTVIQHETAHQVAFNVGLHPPGADNPKWFVEGLACLLESPPNRFGGGFGITNQYRFRDLRDAVAGDRPKRRLTAGDYLEAIADGRIVSPERLVSDARLFQMRGLEASRAYASAWALMQYLFRARREELAAYAREIQQRPPGRRFSSEEELECFQHHFGRINEVFLKRWAGYLARLRNIDPPGG